MDGNYAITVERRMGSQVLTADRRSDQTVPRGCRTAVDAVGIIRNAR
jgi:hypothetical protein